MWHCDAGEARAGKAHTPHWVPARVLLPWEAADEDPSTWMSDTHVESLAPGFMKAHASAFVGIWEVSQQMEDLSPSPF